MNTKRTNVVEVTFLETGQRKLFTSLQAIFDHHSTAELGCNIAMLWAAQVSQGNEYRNHRICVKKRVLLGRVK